jgi:hypothetical protein
MCCFSAKGAAFTLSLGHRPRIHIAQKAQALKARFISVVIFILALPHPPTEARLQRLFCLGNRIPGAMAQAVMIERLWR